MRQYYIQPIEKTLVCYDTETKELIVMEKITRVRIATAGSFDLSLQEGFDDETPTLSALRKRNNKSQRTCTNCKQLGHMAKTCPNPTA